MSEWKEYRLKDITTRITKGTTPSTIGGAFISNGINFIKSESVSYNGRIDKSTFAYVSEETHYKLKRSQLEKNDILFSMAGIYLGKSGFVTDDILPANTNQALAIIKVDPAIAISKFIHFALQQKTVIEYVNTISGQSAQPNINMEEIGSIELFLPPLPEQESIVEVLSSLDDKIDLLHRQNKTLEQMAETLFRQWFESEESEPDKPLSEFLDFLEGPGLRHWQYTLSGVRFINIRLIDEGELHVETANFVAEEEAYGRYKHFLLQEKDMVVSTSGTLGKSAIVRKYHLPLMLNTSVIRFRPTDGKSYSFMYQYLQSKAFLDHLETTASGSVQANFGPSHLKMMTVSFPTKEKIQVFSSRLDPLYDKINHNYSQMKQLEQTRNTLLPKLMSGAVRVKN